MKARPREPNLTLRLNVVLMALTLCVAALLVRAADVQLLRPEFYQQQGDARFLRTVPIAAYRGSIFDRNGEPLAISTPVDSLWANPPELLAARERIPELAAALGTDAEALERLLLQRSQKEFVFLKRQLPPDAAEAVLARGIPGVYTQREFRRFYPAGEVTAPVLGLTNVDDRGLEGLELAFDTWMTGKPGAKRVIRDRKGRSIEDVDLLAPAEPGRDLYLSLDLRLQYLAWRELKAAIHEHRASSGSVVVLDVRNGEVLAMANWPSFNPNVRQREASANWRNRAVTDVFEPGSVIKTFTIAAALESGKFKPNTPIDTTPGTLPVGRHVVRDVHPYGVLDVTRVLTKSSNVGATKMALSLSNEQLYDVFRRFGFGQVTGSGFPGESPGILPHPRQWREVEKATLSYGYGLSTTALQLAQAHAAIARGGRIQTPSFVKGVTNPDAAVIDPSLAAELLRMLETVTGPQGTALLARVANYRVAGKTGTARKASAAGYQSRYVSVFAGLAPVSDPRLVCVVVLHDPSAGAYFGGLTAAPVFGRVMAGALRLLNVPPDDVGSPNLLLARSFEELREAAAEAVEGAASP